MTPRILTATVAFIIAPFIAHAACPTQADMAKGVVTKTDDGQVEIHKTAAKDMVQVQVQFNDGTQDGSIMQFGHGIYLRNVIPIEGGVLRMADQEKYASDATLRSWAAPVPNAAWSNTRADGGTAKSGPMKKVRVGNCAYDGFTVTLGFADDPNYVEVYEYIPSLGLGLLTEILENGDRDRYRYTSIAKQ
ncbi:MAG: hypothetical protein AAFY90_00955 [Pseudomonadota bacterium]